MKMIIIIIMCAISIFSAEYWVRSTGGDDGNAGTSFAVGWATLQYAFDNISAGDTLFICATSGSPFTVSAQCDIDATTGTNAAVMKIYGADLTDGSPYNGSGQAYINTSSSITAVINMAETMEWYHFFDLNINGGGTATNCWTSPAADGWDAHAWVNCRFTNAAGTGFYARTGEQVTFFDCEFDNNGGAGISGPTTASRCTWHLVNGKAHHNDSYGIVAGNTNYVFLVGCSVYRNGADGFWCSTNTGGKYCILNSVFFANTGDGIFVDANSDGFTIRNCIMMDNTAYGLSIDGQNDAREIAVDYNCYYDNGTAATDMAATPGTNNVTSDPLFVSETDNSEDFSLQAGSPCLNTGKGY